MAAAAPGLPSDGPPPLAPGALLLPGYRVVGQLRRGEELDVYDVWSDARGCRCVAKTVRPDRADRPATRARLLREGRLLLRLTHPHIVRAYEVVPGPPPVVVLETLPGETLARLLDRRGRGLAVAEIAHLGLHLCSAVAYLHRSGVLHLDLKPSNVVAARGVAKLLDLSHARRPGRARGGSGTPGYMAPEQVRGGLLGVHTDVWGLGAVLYEAATGEPPGETGDASVTEEAEQQIGPVAPVRSRRRLPASLATAIDRCLDPDPERRPALCELREALAATVGSDGAP